jgi:riboflavin kinase/FMN adenylyltransferase
MPASQRTAASGRGAAVTIGNFDGVHRAHQALVRAARACAGDGGRVVAVTFEPPPAFVLRPERRRPRLTLPAEREALLCRAGADEVRVIPTTRELLELPARTFLARLLDDVPEARFVVEGSDFRFGRDREGSADTLRALEAAFGHRTVIIDPVEVALAGGHVVRASSTIARWLVARGRVRDAAAVLGRPYAMVSRVVPGDRRGRSLGVPTANLEPTEQLLPADGIYAGRARRRASRGGEASRSPQDAARAGPWFPAAISVGTKPTFDGGARTCEAHLIEWRGAADDYGWTIELEVTDWLRDQLRYTDVAALVAQIRRDVARVAASAARDEAGALQWAPA